MFGLRKLGQLMFTLGIFTISLSAVKVYADDDEMSICTGTPGNCVLALFKTCPPSIPTCGSSANNTNCTCK